MIRCKLLASFYANKEGAASPKKHGYLYTFILKPKLPSTICKYRLSQKEQEVGMETVAIISI